jgi:hypothetical protein
MAKLTAEERDADALESFLLGLGHKHLRVRRRADVLTIESGPTDDPYPHARLRRVTVQYWRLEMPNSSGKWDLTPFRGLRADVQKLLVDSFPWTIAALE